MSTRWDTAEIAAGFEAYDDLPERVLGYPLVFDALRLADPEVRVVLDFGCGPGKVAERMVGVYGSEVIAVDSSPAMLDIARQRRANPMIDYRLVTDADLSFVDNDGIDAAMSCYVFINIGSFGTIRAIAHEVYRVLRPGARYAVLDTNPDTTGVDFATFRSGDPGWRYSRGEPRRVLLRHPDGGNLMLLDYHWPKESYREVLADAGFHSITMHEPVLANGQNVRGPWRNEEHRPPFLIIVGEK
jgi:SAM-dependent methyltransferase